MLGARNDLVASIGIRFDACFLPNHASSLPSEALAQAGTPTGHGTSVSDVQELRFIHDLTGTNVFQVFFSKSLAVTGTDNLTDPNTPFMPDMVLVS